MKAQPSPMTMHKKRTPARYTHETIALGFSITEEAVEDNLYDSLSARYTKALARGFQHTKEVKGAALFNEGFLVVKLVATACRCSTLLTRW